MKARYLLVGLGVALATGVGVGAFVVLSPPSSCTIGYADSNVNVTLSGPDAASECAAQIHPANPAIDTQVAFATVPHGWIVCIGQIDTLAGYVGDGYTVRDTGEGILGSTACQEWSG